MKIGLVVRVQQLPSAESKVQVNLTAALATRSLVSLMEAVAARESEAELQYIGFVEPPSEDLPKFWGDDQCED